MSADCSDLHTKEEDLIAISSLQHYQFCPRQCALIHLEQAWSENRSTAEGRLFHERVHNEKSEIRDGILIARGLRLSSHRYRLTGVTDAVEFHPVSATEQSAIVIPHRKGHWVPFPVEYKKGSTKESLPDAIQLCAQTLCLEEMLGVTILEGALFYGTSHRRKSIAFTTHLRDQTTECIHAVHALLASGKTPAAVFNKKCDDCSLMAECCPERTANGSLRVDTYLRQHLLQALSQTENPS